MFHFSSQCNSKNINKTVSFLSKNLQHDTHFHVYKSNRTRADGTVDWMKAQRWKNYFSFILLLTLINASMPGCQYIYNTNDLAYFEALSIRQKSFFIDGTFLLMLLQEQQRSCFVVGKFSTWYTFIYIQEQQNKALRAQWAQWRHKDEIITSDLYCF